MIKLVIKFIFTYNNPVESKKPKLYLFLISLAGTLFAGYLTGTKLISGVCALNETCPVLFGQPACLFGFLIYLTLLILSIFILFLNKNKTIKYFLLFATIVAGIGILFSIYASYLDFLSFTGFEYALILPSCIYGFFMFLLYFYLSYKNYKHLAFNTPQV